MPSPFTREQRETLLSRLALEEPPAHSKVKTPCLVYTGLRNVKGYGRIRFGKIDHYAHRVAAMIKLGRKLEPEEVAMHRCDNPPCCNPQHLKVGTIAANNADRARKGRSGKATKREPNFHPDDVVKIRMWAKLGQGPCRIAATFGCTYKRISDVLSFKTYRHVREDPNSLFSAVME